MKIKVRFCSYIKSKIGKSCIDLNIPENTSIKIPINELGQTFLRIFIVK